MNRRHDLHTQRRSGVHAASRPDLTSPPTPRIESTPYQRLLDEFELNLPPDVRIKRSHVSYDCAGVDVEILLEEEAARIRIAAHIGTPRPVDELEILHGLLAHQLDLTTPAFVVVGWDRASAGFHAISHHYPSDEEVQLEPFVAHLEHCVYTARILRHLYFPDVNGADRKLSVRPSSPSNPP